MYEIPEILTGDCRDLFPALAESPRLIFADPPFGIGQEYQEFDDVTNDEDYADFTKEWGVRAVNALAADGTLCVHVPDARVFDVESAARAYGLTRADWVVWHFRFGQCTRGKFISSKAHCLVYVKDPHNRCWNPDAVLVTSDRVRYGDARTQTSKTPGRRVPLDVWGPWEGKHWGRVPGNSQERRPGHPNQLPEKYLERIVLAYSDPGDLVCDPFTGSGTAAVVADALGRRFVGFEISSASAASARERLCQGAVRLRRPACAT